MCFGRCTRYIGYQLLVLALLCIVANVLLYFPNGETRYAAHNLLSKYVGCLHGIIGGGLVVLVPAFVLIGLEHNHFHGCFDHEHCGRNCTPLLVVLVACIGLAGAAYCFIICCLALSQGPYCFCWTERIWCYPFSNSYGGYLLEHKNWGLCREPRYIVQWNVTLFSILLILSAYELILCIIQIIHGCLGGAWAVCHGPREVIKKKFSPAYKNKLFRGFFSFSRIFATVYKVPKAPTITGIGAGYVVGGGQLEACSTNKPTPIPVIVGAFGTLYTVAKILEKEKNPRNSLFL